MKKLRGVLAAALLVVPVLTLDASTSGVGSAVSELQSTHPLAGTCYIFVGGRWWAYPC